MVDYSRWDNIDDDEDDEVPNLRADYTRKAAHHQASMQLIAEQLKQVWVLTEEQTAHLLDFLAVQHRGVYEDNLRRATEIVAFIEARQAPSTRPLHALAYRASQTAKESDDQQQVSQAKKIFDVAVGALNTVAACEAAGGARRLFDEMHREPEGPTARRYRALEFATEQLRHPAPDPRATEVDPKDWPLLRALVLQVIVGLLASGCALLILRAMGFLRDFQTPPRPLDAQIGEAALRDPALASALRDAGVHTGVAESTEDW